MLLSADSGALQNQGESGTLCLFSVRCLTHGGCATAVAEFHTVGETPHVSGRPPARQPAKAGVGVSPAWSRIKAGASLSLGGLET